jgi:hypothetical protein
MDALSQLPVSAPLLLLATVAVVAGAPLFAAGRRAFQLRRALSGLRAVPIDAQASGLVTVRGRVALEGPMFAPLSGTPCAGWTLEVAGDHMRVGDQLHELRQFRLAGEHASARVVTEQARWDGTVTCERSVAPGEALPERLSALLEQSAEVRWLRDQAVPLRICERALEVGAEVYVTGMARAAAPARVAADRREAQVHAMVESVELAATGTDGRAWSTAGSGAVTHGSEPELWIEPDEPFEQVLVSSHEPVAAALAPPLWKLTLMLLGPALTLAGLLYLARVAGPMIAGRF